MLKADILKKNEALKDLTDEQIKAIETLSKNDEEVVIGEKVGEIHGQYDRDIEEATGLKKPQGVKTYEWMKSDVLSKVKKAQDLEKQLGTLKTEKSNLEKQIADGATDDNIKQQLADAKGQITALQNQLTEEKQTWETKLQQEQEEKSNILVDNEFAKSLTGVKFKPESVITKNLRESYIESAKKGILAEFEPDWVDNGNGGKQLVMRDKKTNEIARNPENSLNPFTPGELLSKRITDVIDTGKQQQGAGTGKPGNGNPGNQGGDTLDLSGATNQVEADKLARKYLMDKGIERGSEEFTEEFTKIRTENQVEKLPIR